MKMFNYIPLQKFSIDPLLGGAIVSAGASILNGIGGIFAQKDANRKNYQQQLALLENQQNFTREMWNKQVSENRQSVVNQMNQYRQIGINPLAVAGGVSQTNQTAPSAPSAPQANYRSPIEGAQLAVIMSEAMKNIAEAKRTEAETPKTIAETAYTWSLQQTEDALRKHRIDMLGIDIKLGDAKINLTKKEVERIDGQLSMMVKQKEQIDASIRNETLLAYDDYMRSVDNWLNHRAQEQHWSVCKKNKSGETLRYSRMKLRLWQRMLLRSLLSEKSKTRKLVLGLIILKRIRSLRTCRLIMKVEFCVIKSLLAIWSITQVLMHQKSKRLKMH